jgi:hypothetical protein
MKYVLLAALLFSTGAFAQTPNAHAPKVGSKPLVQIKPTAPQDCRLVGTVKGTKLWAGDCIPIDWKNPVTGTADNPVTGSVERPLREEPTQVQRPNPNAE